LRGRKGKLSNSAPTGVVMKKTDMVGEMDIETRGPWMPENGTTRLFLGGRDYFCKI
jgi:hypothetical protein